MKRIEFKFNEQKAKEAILYLANKKENKSIDKMSLYKFLFYADIEHLNKFRRPIFGGYYVAMPFGPVPSQVKDMLEKKKHEEFEVVDYWIIANREANLDYLSKTDTDMLDMIYGKLGNFSPSKLSNMSHEHIAWQNAKKINPKKNNNKLDYKDFITVENIELIPELEEYSRCILI